jgi:murein DD-endopeptidase MepM/ murein hydrolase activator NlpD
MTEAEKLTLTDKGRSLKRIIDRNHDQFACVIQPPLTKDNTYHIHISESRNIFSDVDSSDPEACWQVVKNKLEEERKVAAVGGYGEKRTAYRVNPSLYGNDEEERCIHIGIDIWMEAGTPIHAPLDATVHSFADNDSLGNYGPTIILEHELEGVSFYTLHGHLTRESLAGLEVGQHISKGDVFAAIGAAEVNGNWPPHLHYQFIADMMGNEGDFIGVTTEAETDFYLSLCPEPVVF